VIELKAHPSTAAGSGCSASVEQAGQEMWCGCMPEGLLPCWRRALSSAEMKRLNRSSEAR